MSFSLRFWEFAEYISAAIVIIGVIGEYVSDFRMKDTTKADKAKKDRVGKQATWTLIVGLVLELISLVNTNFAGNREIETLKNSTVEANEKLETEKRERLALEAFISPRSLGDQASFNLGLQKYPGITAMVDVIRDAECRRLADELVSAIQGIKVGPKGLDWKVQYNAPIEDSPAGDGVSVEYNTGYWRRDGDNSGPAAELLASVLNSRGIDAAAIATPSLAVPGFQVLPPNTIHVTVGLKPTRELAEARSKARAEFQEQERRFKSLFPPK